MPTLVTGANELEAWRAGVGELIKCHGELFHLVTEITQPGGMQGRALRAYDGRSVRAGKDSVAGVATTICPYRFYAHSANRHDFYQRGRAFLRRLRERRLLSSNWGETYFERLVAFQGTENQLETAIQKMSIWPRSSRTGTSPMRRILRREKYHHKNLFNTPVDFSCLLTASA
jgi:hypothetical protein